MTRYAGSQTQPRVALLSIGLLIDMLGKRAALLALLVQTRKENPK